MKKTFLIISAITLALILTGSIMFGWAVAHKGSFISLVREIGRQGGSSTMLGESGKGERSTLESKEVKQLSLSFISAKVSIVPSTGDTLRISYLRRTGFNYEIKNDNGIVSIKESSVPWNFSWGNVHDEVTVELPQSFQLDTLHLRTVSGDLICGQAKATNVTCNTTSGGVRLDGLTASTLELKTVSGDVNLKNVTTDLLTTNSTSGDCAMTNVTTTSLKTNTVSGDKDLINVKAHDVNANSTSGDLTAVQCTLGNLTVDTVSGDYSFDLTGSRADYTLSAKTTSGKTSLNGDRYGSGSIISGTGKYMVKWHSVSGDLSITTAK